MASDSKITAWNRFGILVEAKITLSNGAQLTFGGNATQGGEDFSIVKEIFCLLQTLHNYSLMMPFLWCPPS